MMYKLSWFLLISVGLFVRQGFGSCAVDEDEIRHFMRDKCKTRKRLYVEAWCVGDLQILSLDDRLIVDNDIGEETLSTCDHFIYEISAPEDDPDALSDATILFMCEGNSADDDAMFAALICFYCDDHEGKQITNSDLCVETNRKSKEPLGQDCQTRIAYDEPKSRNVDQPIFLDNITTFSDLCEDLESALENTALVGIWTERPYKDGMTLAFKFIVTPYACFAGRQDLIQNLIVLAGLFSAPMLFASIVTCAGICGIENFCSSLIGGVNQRPIGFIGDNGCDADSAEAVVHVTDLGSNIILLVAMGFVLEYGSLFIAAFTFQLVSLLILIVVSSVTGCMWDSVPLHKCCYCFVTFLFGHIVWNKKASRKYQKDALLDPCSCCPVNISVFEWFLGLLAPGLQIIALILFSIGGCIFSRSSWAVIFSWVIIFAGSILQLVTSCGRFLRTRGYYLLGERVTMLEKSVQQLKGMQTCIYGIHSDVSQCYTPQEIFRGIIIRDSATAVADTLPNIGSFQTAHKETYGFTLPQVCWFVVKLYSTGSNSVTLGTVTVNSEQMKEVYVKYDGSGPNPSLEVLQDTDGTYSSQVLNNAVTQHSMSGKLTIDDLQIGSESEITFCNKYINHITEALLEPPDSVEIKDLICHTGKASFTVKNVACNSPTIEIKFTGEKTSNRYYVHAIPLV